MKKIMLIGESECGKTSLLQALRGEEAIYKKTQTLECDAISIDTPGEYLENRCLNSALIITSYEAEIIGFVMSANRASIFAPMFASVFTKPVIGIITKAECKDAQIERAIEQLTLSGVHQFFVTSSITHQGIDELEQYLQ